MATLSVVFGLGSALTFGVSDFLGGLASRRASPYIVVAYFTLVAFCVFALTLPIVAKAPELPALGWSALAGSSYGMANIAYFRGLSHGSMGVVATIMGVLAAAVPICVGVALGEVPQPLAWGGIAGVIVSLPLITWSTSESEGEGEQRSKTSALLPVIEASIAGIGFGVAFTALDFVAKASPGPRSFFWGLLGMAVVGSIVVSIAAALTEKHEEWRNGLKEWKTITLSGVIFALATIAFSFGTSKGLVGLVATLAALSPIATMILARFILGERLLWIHYVGIFVALAGIVLITLGTSKSL